MNIIKIKPTVTRVVDGKKTRVESGVTLDVPVWTLDEISAVEGGAAWAESAIESAILAQARNRGTQATISKTILELITPASREGTGEALKLHREAINALVAFLRTTGKKEAVLKIWAAMAGSAAALATSTQAAKDGLLKQVEPFAESLSAEDAERFTPFLTKLADALAGADDLDESDFE